MPRAEDHDAELAASATHVAVLEDSYAAGSTKLRAETSEIVNYVAKYCEEVEADSARTRRRNKGTERQPPGDGNVKPSSKTIHTKAQEGGEAEGGGGMTAERGGSQSRSGNAEETAGSGLDGDVEVPGGGSSAESKGSSTEELRGGASACTLSASAGGTGADPSSGEKKNVVEQQGEQYYHLTTLELPDIPLVISTVGYAAIKQSGEERLRQAIEMFRTKEDDALEWSADVPDLWSCWETCSDDRSPIDFGQVMKTQERIQLSSGPRRMQCGWCEARESSGELLDGESSRLLRTMVRANAQVLLLKKDIIVPNVFEADWERSFDDMRLPRSSAEPGGELQQLLLPSDLVRRDDAKIIGAPSNIVSLADSYLHSLQRPDISLTGASMNIPSVWCLEVARGRLAALVAEEFTTAVPQPVVPASSSPASPGLHRTPPEKADESTSSASRPRGPSLSAQIHSGDQDTAMQTSQPSAFSGKLKVIVEDNPLSTDYFLSDRFLRCHWSEPPNEVYTRDVAVREDSNASGSSEPLKYDQHLQQIARPALWDLMRKKVLQVDRTTFPHAFNRVSLEALEAIIYQQFRKVKNMSLNPSATSSVEIVEACTSLRQAVWLHTLRVVSIGQMAAARNGDMMSAIVARILPSAKYKLVLGPSNWKDFLVLLQAIGGSAALSDSTMELVVDAPTCKEDPTLQLPPKRQRVLQSEKEVTPVRVLCSIEFLEQDELLDELCTEQQIFFIERDLPPPIDILVDETNCICVVTEDTFQVEANMRGFIYSLARLQVQLKKCWLVIALSSSLSTETEDMMNSFLAALAQFRIEIQVLTSFSCEEAGRFVRAVVDGCAEVALRDHRILPRLWFERPFLLEEESQFERFLVSTRIVNHYAAQSLLHKICMEDLFSKRLDALKLLVQKAVTDEQLELLWRLVQQNHGLNPGV
ncbi:hypothetical protein PHYPSEUDO_005397 [Phytophthora pseudosyringae]|uniref:Uncharacterized protein n=1 Tax=Phytophthora pseudosyringae TaxID=221518 RepID=A0A8T1VPK5_9STRA|nr:hypothetical protein PHYPSEUDO_005397 [Phytophthora pseudosyringae]